ncbi:hypothetical protein HX870_08995 [Pseudomonas gingeri]|uniref:dermonecrotic toxin domain-containing protein n=1 Tax=Pseudomonas gingeri TaxID=117681 RepID=UPI0015A10B0F|nr:DUF6543 domain-containing protein [Pseudomonas gingeri]NWD67727.1 hypothetical protein [Pseudomonas gingeri]
MRLSEYYRDEIDAALNQYQPLAQFAAPRVVQALADNGLGRLDPRLDCLFIAPDTDADTGASDLPARSLLDSALQSFARVETSASGFTVGTVVRRPLAAGGYLQQDVEPHTLAQIFRELDLGGRYQEHLQSIFHCPRFPGAEPVPMPDPRLSFLLERHRQAGMLFDAHIAYLNNDIEQPAYEMLCRVLNLERSVKWAGQPVQISHLSMLGAALEGGLLFTAANVPTLESGACVVYLPNEPACPFREHVSMAAFSDWLAQKIGMGTDYRYFIDRLVDYRLLPEFDKAVLEQATEYSRGGACWLFTTEPVSVDLFRELVRLQLTKLVNDARELAIPTGTESRAERQARWRRWHERGVSAAQLSLYGLPEPGALVLGGRSRGLFDLFYEGWRDWRARDRLGLIDTLMAQMINLLDLEPGEREQLFWARGRPLESDFCAGLIAIMDEQRVLRLWNPDPGPYEHRRALLVNEPDAQGLLSDGDGRYVRIDGKVYRLDDQAFDGRRRLKHPTRAGAYSPLVLHNGEGAWRFAFENPAKWSDEIYLFRRLGPIAEGLSDAVLQQVLKVTGTSAAVLRRLHVDLLPVPRTLTESLRRARQREASGGAAEVLVTSVVEPLPRQFFPELPACVERELIADANDVQRYRLLVQGRIPLALSETALRRRVELTVNRVNADFLLNDRATFETDCLAFHMLERLPGWPDNLRLELHYTRQAGQGVTTFALGPESAAFKRHLSANEQRGNEYQVLDASNQPLVSVASLLQAVLLALLSEHCRALGFNRPEPMREALVELALRHRHQAARLCALSRRVLHEEPQGYPLLESAPGDSRRHTLIARVNQLYPLLPMVHIRTYLQSLGTAQQAVALLELRERESARLKAQLLTWVEAADSLDDPLSATGSTAASRKQLAYSIKRAWEQGGWGPAGARVRVTLDLQGMRVGRLPELDREIDFGHVSELIARNMALTDADQGFLNRFSGLLELDLGDNRLTALPEALFEMAQLTHLYLQGNQISLGADSAALLTTMASLETLNLNGNPLAQLPDLGGLPVLRRLMLRDTGIDRWPNGLFTHIALEALDLRNNRIASIPPELFNAPAAVTRYIGLQGNPLSEENLRRLAALKQNAGISLGVAPLPLRGSAQEEEDAWIEPCDPAEPVTTACQERLAAQKLKWQRLRAEPMAEGFFLLFWRLHLWSREQNPWTQEETALRVWSIVDAATHDTVLREALFSYADGPQSCTETLETLVAALEKQVAAASF